MITGFRYRIVKRLFGQEVYYCPEFKTMYSKYDIRRYFQFWQVFVEKKYGYTKISSGYYLYDVNFVSKTECNKFISQFPKEWTKYSSSVSPLMYNNHQKKLFKTEVEEL